MPPRRVLAIDDEPVILRLVRLLGENLGAEVRTTSEPEAFAAQVRDWSPDFVLVDLHMPHLDGLQILRELAAQHCSATVIAMSGFDPKVLRAARAVGVALGLKMGEVLHKPLTPGDFARVLSGRAVPRGGSPTDALANAIDRDELVLHYQPIVELATGRAIAVEALSRWDHPTRGLLFPDCFIPLAETSGLIDKLTSWVLRTAVAQAAEWLAAELPSIVCVNISAHNIQDRAFPDMLMSLCEMHGVPADHICLELTETAATRDPIRMKEVLSRLRLKGFKLALDDFGTGYSSLQQLRLLPFTELKIDKSFVLDMLDSDEAATIVGSTVALAGALKLDTIGEGIETEAHLLTLRELGCRLGQGFFISRPMTALQTTDFLTEQKQAIEAA